MEKPAQSFDVCVVCALPEEARVFFEVVQRQCENLLEEGISPRYQYSYRFTTLKNDKGEPLKVHVSWLPRYGSEEMTLHLSRVLEECQPRIAMMTGICAGDAQRVQLGDLVVAERTFTYDNGKFTLNDGRKIHLHDTMTYQLDANTLQFLGVFDKWKPLVAGLKRPPSGPEQRKRRKIACHIKPMASGSAVRADHPFEDVQAPVRGTVAIDMEGAAFGLVMSRHPQIPWLVVKGVCDYADQDKNDAYHDYAARASALYALSFIRAYVTNERLPRPGWSSPASRAEPSGVWNVPYRRNPHFTGRDDLLDRIQQQLTPPQQSDSTQARRVALTQPQAIKGLGGIGKTQVALEYAYRSRDLERYTHTFWINAATEETVITSFMEIAELLPLFSEKDEADQQKLMEAIKRWLERCEQSWLLIFDNADDLSLVRKYLPQQGNGSILLTTRANAVGSLAAAVEVETMGFFEGTQLLLRRAQRFQHASDEEVNQAGNIVIRLDHFPLALDQAGAYLEETGCSFTDYLEIYQNHRNALLARRGEQAVNYPASVATTWSLSFQKVQQKSPAAAELLQLCAFLAPDRIPEELIKDGAAHWPSLLKQVATDRFEFNQMIEELLKFSLVKRLVGDRALNIHRLVQAVQMDAMEPQTQRQWAESVVRAVNDVFPKDSQDTAAWPQCLRYLDQAQACHKLIEHYGLAFIEGASLLNRAGLYLDDHALYAIAEPLYQCALAIKEEQLGPEHPSTSSSLNNLAELYENQGRYNEAEPLFKRALAIDTSVYGAEHVEVATDLNNLAHLYQTQGRYNEAEPLYQRALAIKKQQSGPEHPSTASSLNNLAGLYRVQGKYSEAELLYQHALAIYEQQLGPKHPSTASSLNNLAYLYQTQGKYNEAEPLYRRALAIKEEQLGPEHPSMANSLNNLAALYYAQGKYNEAEPLYRRALAIKKQQLGAGHPDIAQNLNNLAELYRVQGKYEEAEPLCQDALAIREQQLGGSHPDTAQSLNNLAALYYAQGKYNEAEPLFKRALAIDINVYGAEHLEVATDLNNLAHLYSAQSRYSEAESLYRRALAISRRQLGLEHPLTQQRISNYLRLLSEIHTGGDLEALLQLLAQGEQDDDKDEGNTEKASS